MGFVTDFAPVIKGIRGCFLILAQGMYQGSKLKYLVFIEANRVQQSCHILS